VAFGVLVVLALVIVWTTRSATTERAELRQSSCTWHRDYVLVSGVVRNTGLVAHDFQITPTYWLAGVGERGAHDGVRVPSTRGGEAVGRSGRQDV
jgi:hypothetical protein